MGLDQYLTAKIHLSEGKWRTPVEREQYRAVLEAVEAPTVQTEMPMASVEMNVAYWRKENAIHEWFVQNIQDGEDNCAEYYVSHEQLENLVETCQKVLDNPGLADELLPTASGFFFGSTDYDEWYFSGLAYTVKTLTELLNNQEFKGWHFYYQSSW